MRGVACTVGPSPFVFCDFSRKRLIGTIQIPDLAHQGTIRLVLFDRRLIEGCPQQRMRVARRPVETLRQRHRSVWRAAPLQENDCSDAAEPSNGLHSGSQYSADTAAYG